MSDGRTFSIPGTGQLSVVAVYDHFNGPKLVNFRSASGATFLGYWAGEDTEGERWLLLPLSPTRLRELADATIDMRTAMSEPESGALALLLFSPGAHDPAVQWMLATDTSLTDLLPEKGEFLLQGALPSVAREELSQADQQPEWEPLFREPLLLDGIVGTIEETRAEALSTGREFVTVKFGTRLHEIGSRVLADFLTSFQIAVDGFANAPSARLNVFAHIPSSFKLQLVADEPPSNLFGTSVSSEGLRVLFGLLEMGDDIEKLRDRLTALPRLSAGRYGRVVSALGNAETNVTLCWGSPSPIESRAHVAGFTWASAKALASALKEMDETDKKPYEVEGVLTLFGGVRRRSFELQTAAGLLTGKFAPNVFETVPNPAIRKRYVATIQDTVAVSAAGYEEIKHKLLGLRDVPEDGR